MKNLNRIDQCKPVTAKKLYGMIGEEKRICFYFALDLDTFLEVIRGWPTQLEGLNARVDELWYAFCPQVQGSLSDIAYEFCNHAGVGAGHYKTGIKVAASTSALEWPEDVMTEERRRDEKFLLTFIRNSGKLYP